MLGYFFFIHMMDKKYFPLFLQTPIQIMSPHNFCQLRSQVTYCISLTIYDPGTQLPMFSAKHAICACNADAAKAITVTLVVEATDKVPGTFC